MLVRLILVGVLPATMLACTKPEDSDIPDLPDETDSPIIDDTGPFEIPEDTDDLGPTDLEPTNFLYMYQEGITFS